MAFHAEMAVVTEHIVAWLLCGLQLANWWGYKVKKKLIKYYTMICGSNDLQFDR